MHVYIHTLSSCPFILFTLMWAVLIHLVFFFFVLQPQIHAAIPDAAICACFPQRAFTPVLVLPGGVFPFDFKQLCERYVLFKYASEGGTCHRTLSTCWDEVCAVSSDQQCICGCSFMWGELIEHHKQKLIYNQPYT